MKLSVAAISAISMIFIASSASADNKSVENAYGLCQVFDKTGLVSEPCSVSGWNSSVDVRMDTNGGEARKVCSAVVQMVRKQGLRFDNRWKIRIYSPYSGDRPIAQCRL